MKVVSKKNTVQKLLKLENEALNTLNGIFQCWSLN